MMKYFTAIILSLCWVQILQVYSRFVEIKPLRFRGTVTVSNAQDSCDRFAVFFGRKNVEIIESINPKTGSKEVVLCDAISLPISDTSIQYLIEREFSKKQSKPSSVSALVANMRPPSLACIMNREGGLYDNLPYSWQPGNSKKQLFDFVNRISGRGSQDSTALHYAVEANLGCEMQALLLEPSDQFAGDKVALGGAALLAKGDSDEKLSYSPVTRVLRRLTIPSGSDESSKPGDFEVEDDDHALVSCFADELALLAVTSDTPVYIDEDLFNDLSGDAVIDEQRNGDISIRCVTQVTTVRSATEVDAMGFDVPVPAAWEVMDPKAFFRWTTTDKRAILRKSGVKVLPRPREGEEALDTLLLEKMDDAVRSEVLRLQLSGQGAASRSRAARRPSATSYVVDDQSDPKDGFDAVSRQDLLRRIGECIDGGDLELAVKLRQEFQQRTALRADPTQPEGSYSRYLDQDDWYAEARRRSMRKNP